MGRQFIEENFSDDLQRIEKSLHELIMQRNNASREDLESEGFEFPSLEAHVADIGEEAPEQIIEEDGVRGGHSKYYDVPGMCGGFDVSLAKDISGHWVLLCESWCRVVGGSGQRHRITSANGVELLEEGFV